MDFMKLYCRCCGVNHSLVLSDVERVIYAMEVSLADSLVEFWSVEGLPPAEVRVVCLLGMLQASYDADGLAEYVDLAVGLRQGQSLGILCDRRA